MKIVITSYSIHYTKLYDSYAVLNNNWQNADGTVTIYAKGKDSLGNEVTVQKILVNLDLDAPSNPIITSSSGYPVINIYGVTNNASVTITYDNRTDIDNYS